MKTRVFFRAMKLLCLVKRDSVLFEQYDCLEKKNGYLFATDGRQLAGVKFLNIENDFLALFDGHYEVIKNGSREIILEPFAVKDFKPLDYAGILNCDKSITKIMVFKNYLKNLIAFIVSNQTNSFNLSQLIRAHRFFFDNVTVYIQEKFLPLIIVSKDDFIQIIFATMPLQLEYKSLPTITVLDNPESLRLI